MALIKCRECGKEISDKAKTCPNCGKANTNNVNAIDDKKAGIIILVILVFVFVVSLAGYNSSSNNENKKSQGIAITSDNTITISNNAEIKYTDIKKFDYQINGSSLKLERYNGSEKTVRIADNYTIDNNTYTVTELGDAIFNGSDVNKIYFPRTLNSITDNLLAYLSNEYDDHTDIYYEGSQEEWNNIFQIYEATSVSDAYHSGDASGLGIALADKLNAKMGHKYDESKFTYHYNASLEDTAD